MAVNCGNRAHRTSAFLDAEDIKFAGTFHATVADVRKCFSAEGPIETLAEAARFEEERWAMESEFAAERAAERYWEEGPNGPIDDPRERELWAMEDYMAGLR